MGRWLHLLKLFDETCGTSHDPFAMALHPVRQPLGPQPPAFFFLCFILPSCTAANFSVQIFLVQD